MPTVHELVEMIKEKGAIQTTRKGGFDFMRECERHNVCGEWNISFRGNRCTISDPAKERKEPDP